MDHIDAEELKAKLDRGDEIIVYDSGPGCSASRMALRILRAVGMSVCAATPVGWRSGHA